jgi:hypothetical protein
MNLSEESIVGCCWAAGQLGLPQWLPWFRKCWLFRVYKSELFLNVHIICAGAYMWSEMKTWPNRSDLIGSTDEILHCYNRGVNKQQIFFGHDFYALFLSLVETFHSRDELKILAYCLMPNHFHFLFRQVKAFALSKLMEKVCGEYAKSVNQVCQRVGHLF